MDYMKSDGGRKDAGYKTTKPFNADCVIRSISIILDEDYKAVFNEIMQLAIKMGGYPSFAPVYEKYLKSKGCIKNRCPRDANGKLIKLNNWTYTGRAIVLSSGHLTAVVNGTVHDMWDCRYRPVNSFWTSPSTIKRGN